MCPSQSNFRRRSRSRSRSRDRRRLDDRRGDYDRRKSIRSNSRSRSRSGSPRGGSPGPRGRYYESRQSGDSSARSGSPARQQYNSRDFGRNVDESKSQSQSRNRNWSNERSRSRSQDSHRNGRSSDYSRSRSRSLSYKSRSRSSSSSYSRSRSRSKSRSRNRNRSRSRSRSRNRSYDRQFNDTYKGSREEDRGSRPFKKPYDFDDIERSEREPTDYNYDSYEDEDEDDYDSGRRGHRPQKRGYKEALTRGEPNDVLLVSGAQSEWTKNVILKAFESICPLGAVQIVRSRKGYMAPFCYVEVYNKEIAEKLVNATNGKVMVGGKEATLYYAKRSGPLKCDWFCQNCHFLNFASRCETGICFRCCAPRPEKEIDLLNRESEQLEHYIALSKPMEIEDPCTKLISDVPTTTILLRGLDNMTTEETIASHFSSFGIEIASVQLIRSKETLLSFGAARVTFDTVEDCQKGMAKVQSAPLSGVVPQICFAKPIDTTTETDIFIPETRRKLIEEQEAQLREWDKLRQETEREQPAAPPEPIPEPVVNEPTAEEISAAAEKTADDEFNALLQEIDAVSQKETQKQEALKNVEDEQMANGSEEELVDYNRLVCLLCQRQFNSIEQLTKHVDRSQLHKDNLAKRNTHQKETRWGKPSWQQRQHQYQTKWDTASKNDAAEPSSQTEAQFFGDTARGGLGFCNSALAQQQQQGKDQQEQKFQSRIQQYVNSSYTSQKFRNFARYDWHAGEH